MRKTKADESLEELIKAAYEHDQDSPEMGFGDLEAMLRSAWARLSAKDKKELRAEFQLLVDEWLLP